MNSVGRAGSASELTSNASNALDFADGVVAAVPSKSFIALSSLGVTFLTLTKVQASGQLAHNNDFGA